MKKGLYLILVSTMFVLFNTSAFAQCNPELVDICKGKTNGATYMKHFISKLKAAEPKKPVPISKFAMVLSKGNVYRFNVANATEYPGQGILQLYDDDKLMGTTYFKGKDYGSFDFNCAKTGNYIIYISYADGKMGCAVGMLSLVKK